jgi:hypothetical protein
MDDETKKPETLLVKLMVLVPELHMQCMQLIATQLNTSVDEVVGMLLHDGMRRLGPLSYTLNARKSLEQARVIEEHDEWGYENLYKRLTKTTGEVEEEKDVSVDIDDFLKSLTKKKKDKE